jgi:hypothetical protein
MYMTLCKQIRVTIGVTETSEAVAKIHTTHEGKHDLLNPLFYVEDIATSSYKARPTLSEVAPPAPNICLSTVSIDSRSSLSRNISCFHLASRSSNIFDMWLMLPKAASNARFRPSSRDSPLTSEPSTDDPDPLSQRSANDDLRERVARL